LPPLPEQPPVIAEAMHTWHIENWQSLPRREHGPVFEAGGFPW
jgi:ubiquitin carboxyl-terminal hydrolase 7